ncbi:MAG: gliding motility-associated C-terminal domain-containing protein [Chitinophagaceae bacterium]
MRIFFLILFFSTLSFYARADHITGGEMYYTYSGIIDGEYQYVVTLKLFMRCNSGRQFPNPAIISVFDKVSNNRIRDISVPLSNQQTIQLTNPDPCISNPPPVCYVVAYYNFSVSLPLTSTGYILASQVNYRINGISNLNGSTQVGATYSCVIPGITSGDNNQANNSAVFTGSDLVIVCAGNYFSYSFAAKDDDNDRLRYSFCAAYRSTNAGINGVPPGNPPYNSVPYGTPEYRETSPLANKVSINPETGLISGIAPPAGAYVVTVCVDEIRNGAVIATQRKDVQINIADCSVAAALLEDDYMVCGDTRSASIRNLSGSPLITTYDWAVINPAGITIFTDKTPILNYTFPVNGVYTVQLTVNKGQACSDTGSAPVYVFPGLKPDFSASGICISKPTIFSDQTTTVTGTVNSWKWDFGELSGLGDFSTAKNPVYTYPSDGIKNTHLIVSTSEGCRDTIIKQVSIISKPFLDLAFRDTLICLNDPLKLEAVGTGNYAWSPTDGIVNANSNHPSVFPKATSFYYVDLEREGCKNKDSVYVRVKDRVSLQLMNDTTICSGDTIQLRINSDGLNYEWRPSGQILNPGIPNPWVVSSSTTNYQVKAIIGGCSTIGNVQVNTIPYPVAIAGNDETICFNGSIKLNAFTNGNSWYWTPSASLSNALVTDPVANPVNTTQYIFTAYNIASGCPKPGTDTILVTVLPKIIASAGKDTSIVINQTLQLSASGGDGYIWSPSYSLSSASIANPVAVFDEPSEGLRYKVEVYNSIGCVDSAFIFVKIFATIPTVFVPSAFTPNNDGKNDVLRPIAAGIKQLEYFNIYNRWGQLVFTTKEAGKGWDGKINGQLQTSNTYVWIVKAVDYHGAAYQKKGIVTLIR